MALCGVTPRIDEYVGALHCLSRSYSFFAMAAFLGQVALHVRSKLPEKIKSNNGYFENGCPGHSRSGDTNQRVSEPRDCWHAGLEGRLNI